MGVSQLFQRIKPAGQPLSLRHARWTATAARIVRASESLAALSDQELLQMGRDIRWRGKTEVTLRSLLPEAYALVRESARRTIGMQHFPVQIMGGIALFDGHVAEMQTGEGKTLTATLPAFLRALAGQGGHVITVNDYLAQRDADQMRPVYEQLGLTVGCVLSEMQSDERRAAYAKDITYGTAKEMGFDFLRDRLRRGSESPRRAFGAHSNGSEAPVQRGHYFALIDEADSILIDEARTPLIIGLTEPNDAATVNLMRWSRRAGSQLRLDIDYVHEPDRRSVYLTDAGCRRILLLAKPSLLDSIATERIYSHVERALTADCAFQRDRDYVVVDEEIVIVDESTGRMMDGRKWQDGLHQAIEAKESLPITAATGQAARVTIQNLFRQYTYLAGMTGTAMPARRELKKTYSMKVSSVPTNKPCIRSGRPGRIFVSMDSKWQSIVAEIETLRKQQRAVLVGTPSVDASEGLGAQLAKRGVPHQILNAKQLEREAEIVSQAGQTGKVTIATNMAGRGTDILLDDIVRKNGGLHVLTTEMHSSARIDRQLIGRAARQGDPGSFQFFLSLDDELLRCLPRSLRERWKRRARPNQNGELSRSWFGVFRRTQRFLEKTHRKQRKSLLRQEKYRGEAYAKMGLDPFLELTE